MSMTVTCHDRTPFANFTCLPCGEILHLHQTQVTAMLEDNLCFTRCKECRAELLLPSRSSAMDLIQDTFNTGDTAPFPLFPLKGVEL